MPQKPWQKECTAVLKTHLAKATEPKEIREISNALSSMQPYEPEPMPVMEVPARRRWTKRPKKTK